MTYQFVEHIDPSIHDACIQTSAICNLLQSSSWAKVKENWGHAIVGVNDDGKLVASALVLIKQLPLGFTMMYIPRGPIMDYQNPTLLNYFMKELKVWAKKHKCVFIKFDPGIQKNRYKVSERDNTILKDTETTLRNLREAGCIHTGFGMALHDSIQPRFHAMVENEDSFEANLPKHTKRHIKTATKKHLEVHMFGSEKVDEFAAIMRLTEKRKNISLRDDAYFKLLLDSYGEDARLFLAQIDVDALLQETKEKLETTKLDIIKFEEDGTKKEKAEEQYMNLQNEYTHLQTCKQEVGAHPYVAACLAVIFGSTCEMLYMGMDDRFKKYMAPYLSHITPMKWAFSKGCQYANMGGVEGSLTDGLTKFKSNFNPFIYEYVGEFDLPVQKLLYKPFIYLYNKRKGTSD